MADHIINHLLSKSPIKTAKEVQQLADDLISGQETLSKIGKLQELDSQKSIIEIIQRLQPCLQTRWKKLALKVKKKKDLYPSFSEFVDFMSQVASEMNDPVYGQMIPRRLHESSPRDQPRSRSNSATSLNSVAGARQTPNPPSSGVSLHHPRRPEPPCVMCGQSHRLWYCDKFKNLKPNQLRLDIVKQYKLCENCLMGNHETSKCRKNSVCSVNGCGKRHTKFIHVDDVVNQNEGNENDNTVKVASANSVFSDSQVYMPIVEVRVNDCYTTYALLDTASTNSFCSKNLVGLLNISGKAQSYNLNTLCGSESKMSEVVSLEVKSVDNTEALYMSNVYVVTDIPTGTSQVNVDKYPHLQDLTLPGVKSGVSVDVLIGQDNAEALVPLEIRRGSRNEPFAIRTMFGWCLNGSTGITYKIPGVQQTSILLKSKLVNSGKLRMM